jgi:spore coat polysaccharide biosynthesis predicted glycosyltransferase SpsG
MKELMLSSDMAVSAGGQTIYELARIGLPTIAVVVVDNQINSVKEWVKTGFLKSVGKWNSVKLYRNLHRHVASIKSFKTRSKISRIGRKLVDGKGPERITDKLVKWSKRSY